MVTQFYRERLVKNLPDAYRKDSGSNNAKILEIEQRAMAVLRESISAVAESTDIETASGKTLDMLGVMGGQARGAATDEQYRILIKSRIVRNLSGADHASIVNAICATFGCKPSEIILTEPETGKVIIDGLPFSKLNDSNIDINTAVAIITNLMPAGVFLDALSFTGTFEFGGVDMEYDADAGFGDEAQTIGGYLGLLSDGQGSNLPV